MAKKDFQEMTYEELLNNYEFKLASKIIKREYPFIKKVIMREPEDINKYSLIFLDFEVDPKKLMEFYGEDLASYVLWNIKNNKTFWSSYLTLFMETGNREKYGETQFNDLLKSVHTQASIPSELKLHPTRGLRQGTFFMVPPYDMS